MATAGFKRQINFSEAISQLDSQSAETNTGDTSLKVRSDFTDGNLQKTGNGLDLALVGKGFFQVRTGNGLAYIRQGHFRLANDGTVVTPQGYILQQAGGGDLTLEHANVQILQDGTILDGARQAGRIGLFEPADAQKLSAVDGSLFADPEQVMGDSKAVSVRQGMVEGSNVDLGSEMITMMAAVRDGETGARMVQVYDDLLGKAISSFGQTR